MDPAQRCAEVRHLTDAYCAGGPESFGAFRDLAQYLLSITVLADGQAVRLASKKGSSRRRLTQVLGSQRGPTAPLKLRDNRWLRLAVTLYLDPVEGGGTRLKVAKSSYQYQADEDGNREIFRYDYLRQPGPDPHPQAHLNIHGRLAHHELDAKGVFNRIHFPTSRVALEGVIRLLVEQFNVPSKLPASEWRPVLAASEARFAEIAHRPLSGPA